MRNLINLFSQVPDVCNRNVNTSGTCKIGDAEYQRISKEEFGMSCIDEDILEQQLAAHFAERNIGGVITKVALRRKASELARRYR